MTDERYFEAQELLIWLPVPFINYFDPDSEKLLDEKIAVMNALKAGKTIEEIPDFYKVLELLPKEGIWD